MIERFSLTDIQADHIANMTLGRLTGMEQQKINDELIEIEAKIADYEEDYCAQYSLHSNYVARQIIRYYTYSE